MDISLINYNDTIENYDNNILDSSNINASYTINASDTINASNTIDAQNFLQDILNGNSITNALRTNSRFYNRIVHTPTFEIDTNSIENLVLNTNMNTDVTPQLIPTSFQSLFNLNNYNDNSYSELSLPTLNMNNTFTDMFINNTINNIINRSFQDKPKYKQVISDEGKECLLYDIYNKDKHKEYNNTCPIFQCDFNDGDNIVILPCNHIFSKDGIERWLQDEKSACPVCRYKLPSKEIKIKEELITELSNNDISDEPNNEVTEESINQDTDDEDDNVVEDNDTEENRTEINRSMLYNILNRVVETPVNNRVNSALNMVINNDINVDLQQAILASIENSTTNNNDISNNIEDESHNTSSSDDEEL